MGGPSAPSFPSGGTVANEQQTANTQTAQQQQGINTAVAGQQQGFNTGSQAGSQYNTYNPLGSTQYVRTGTGPNGVPTYSAVTNYSPIEQALFGTTAGTQLGAGGAAEKLLAGADYGAGTPSQVIGDLTTGMTGKNLGQEVSSLKPFFDIQTEQADAALRNQGISPTSDPEAYQHGMLPVTTGQDTTVANFLASQEPTVWGQQAQAYSLPFQMAESAIPLTTPTSPTSISSQVPQPVLAGTTVGPTTVYPTNVPAAYSAENQAQVQAQQIQQSQYNAMIAALGGIGAAGVKGYMTPTT